MARVMNYTITQIELLQKQGLHPAKILRLLKTEGLAVSLASVVHIIKKLKTTGSVANLPHSGRTAKISDEAKVFINLQMRKDDEMTSCRIKKLVNCTKSSDATWVDFTSDWLLSAHSGCEQNEAVGVRAKSPILSSRHHNATSPTWNADFLELGYLNQACLDTFAEEFFPLKSLVLCNH